MIILITGGCRSGKSEYARRRAEAYPAPRIFLATAPPCDAEMKERIAKHRRHRDPSFWTETIEEEYDLVGVLRRLPPRATILVDCLTLWINNLLYQASSSPSSLLEEEEIQQRAEDLALAARRHVGTVLFVTNEVGMGIVPEDGLTRRYRDLVGRCNQILANEADEVVFLVSGIPLLLRPASR